MPTHKVWRQLNDRKKIVDVLLFPNYLFVYTTNQSRYKLLDITGVVRYVACDGKPVIISDEEIIKIKMMANSEDIASENNLMSGQLVKIISEPFVDLEGVLFKRGGKNRFAVRIEGINNVISIPLDNISVIKIHKSI